MIPKKRFGQNFLQDKNIIDKIINSIDIKSSDNIVEIGPGLGAITKYILDLPKRLDLIELDKDIILFLIEKLLKNKLNNNSNSNNTDSNYDNNNNISHIDDISNITNNSNQYFLHQGDVLNFDFNKIINNLNNNEKIRIIGNLPYNISTQLLFYIIQYIDNIENMYFMLQYEVAERLIAKPKTKSYGRLSILMQYYFDIDILFNVLPQVFYPIPKVNSAFVKFTPKNIKNTNKNNINDINKLDNI